MDAYSIVSTCLSAAALLGVWFFRTPKESANHLERKIATLEGQVNALATTYAGIHGKHDQALNTLTAAVNKLTDRFDAYMGNGHGRTR